MQNITRQKIRIFYPEGVIYSQYLYNNAKNKKKLCLYNNFYIFCKESLYLTNLINGKRSSFFFYDITDFELYLNIAVILLSIIMIKNSALFIRYRENIYNDTECLMSLFNDVVLYLINCINGNFRLYCKSDFYPYMIIKK